MSEKVQRESVDLLMFVLIGPFQIWEACDP